MTPTGGATSENGGRIGAVLVHLSDLHFCASDPGLEERNALIRERLCSDLRTLVDTTGRADVVAITGDIAFGGKRREYEMASEWLQEVIEPVSNGSSRAVCVPGNHDLDWALIGPTHQAHRALIGSTLDEHLDGLLDRYLLEDGQAILHPLEAYNEFAASLGCQILDRLWWEAPLPIAGGYELALRGVTTVINSYNADDPGRLAVHGNQLISTRTPGRIPIMLAHHDPFFWRRHHRLEGDVTKRMSLALYGHTHSPRLRAVDDCIEITAGAVQPEEGKDWMPAYNVIQIGIVPVDDQFSQLRARVWRRRYSTEHDAFISDASDGTSDERSVQILAASPPSPAEAVAAARVEDEPHPEEVRVSLTMPNGTPHPLRQVQRALYRLGAGHRIAILAAIGLPVDSLARLPPYRLIPEAARAIIDSNKADEFLKEAAKYERTAGGGPDD